MGGKMGVFIDDIKYAKGSHNKTQVAVNKYVKKIHIQQIDNEVDYLGRLSYLEIFGTYIQ